jgi:hypothetical protein
LGGHSFSNISGEKTENSRGNADYWAVKLDKSGNIVWDKTIGGNKADRLHGVQQTTDGGYILGGTSYSNKSGEKTEETSVYNDFWVVKLDKSGNIQWDKTIGGSGEDYLKFLKQSKDGGYILGGTSSSNRSGDKTENSKGSIDYWVVKLNGMGNIQWDKTVGGADDEYCRSVQETADGGYIMAGNSFSNKSGDKTENSRGASDYWIVKMDSLRNIEWDRTIGGNKEDGLIEGLYSFEVTSDNGYILGGYSYSNISGEKTENSLGGADFWIVKLDRRGNMQWDKTIGGNKDDELSSIHEFEKNSYRSGGYSNSGISGDKTQKSRGGVDYWLVDLQYRIKPASLPNSLSNLKINSNSRFIIFPNPAKDVLYVQITGKATVSLTNSEGRTLLKQSINNSGTINIANLPSDIYYLKNNSTGEVQKVIIGK